MFAASLAPGLAATCAIAPALLLLWLVIAADSRPEPRFRFRRAMNAPRVVARLGEWSAPRRLFHVKAPSAAAVDMALATASSGKIANISR